MIEEKGLGLLVTLLSRWWRELAVVRMMISLYCSMLIFYFLKFKFVEIETRYAESSFAGEALNSFFLYLCLFAYHLNLNIL